LASGGKGEKKILGGGKKNRRVLGKGVILHALVSYAAEWSHERAK